MIAKQRISQVNANNVTEPKRVLNSNKTCVNVLVICGSSLRFQQIILNDEEVVVNVTEHNSCDDYRRLVSSSSLFSERRQLLSNVHRSHTTWQQRHHASALAYSLSHSHSRATFETSCIA